MLSKNSLYISSHQMKLSSKRQCSDVSCAQRYRMIEESLLAFAVPGSWFYLLFFAGCGKYILSIYFLMIYIFSAIKLTGPFVTMIFSMITGDMFTFSIIFVIFLLGFTQAWHIIMDQSTSKKIYFQVFYFLMKSMKGELYGEYHTTWIALFHMTLGEYEVCCSCLGIWD